jgi:hypothetical protein
MRKRQNKGSWKYPIRVRHLKSQFDYDYPTVAIHGKARATVSALILNIPPIIAIKTCIAFDSHKYGSLCFASGTDMIFGVFGLHELLLLLLHCCEESGTMIYLVFTGYEAFFKDGLGQVNVIGTWHRQCSLKIHQRYLYYISDVSIVSESCPIVKLYSVGKWSKTKK